jgi:hypothetical protein
MTNPRRLNAKVMQGLFLLRERQRACSSRHAAGAALLLLVTLLPGCSDVALADEMPASEPDPGYNNLVAKHLKDTFKNRASYNAFAISAFRWVHSFKGWAWMTCVRFEDNGHPRTYAVFIKDGKVIDSRYAVQTDACNTQTYAVFDAMGPTKGRGSGAVVLGQPKLFCPNRMAQARSASLLVPHLRQLGDVGGECAGPRRG